MKKSVLLPETLAVLARCNREAPPRFPNAMRAELFDAKHSRGPYKILPTTTGKFVIFDTRAPMGEGVVSSHNSEDEAHEALQIVPL